MAEVKMPLAELDDIRGKVLEGLKREEELLLKLSEKDKAIAEIEASKQVLVVTESLNLDMQDDGHLAEMVYIFNSNRGGNTTKLLAALRNGLRKIAESKTITKRSWYNVDDIRKDVMAELENTLGKEVWDLKKKCQEKKSELSVIEERHKRKVTDLDTQNKELLDKLRYDHGKEIKDREKKYNTLVESFKALQEDREHRTTEQKIASLYAALVAERKRTWWQKLWGIKKVELPKL